MGFAEFVLHLTRMNPDMMYLHQDCGYLNISYFKFDIDDQSGIGSEFYTVCFCLRLTAQFLILNVCYVQYSCQEQKQYSKTWL